MKGPKNSDNHIQIIIFFITLFLAAVTALETLVPNFESLVNVKDIFYGLGLLSSTLFIFGLLMELIIKFYNKEVLKEERDMFYKWGLILLIINIILTLLFLSIGYVLGFGEVVETKTKFLNNYMPGMIILMVIMLFTGLAFLTIKSAKKLSKIVKK